MIESLIILIWITFLIGGIIEQRSKTLYSTVIISGLIIMGMVALWRVLGW